MHHIFLTKKQRKWKEFETGPKFCPNLRLHVAQHLLGREKKGTFLFFLKNVYDHSALEFPSDLSIPKGHFGFLGQVTAAHEMVELKDQVVFPVGQETV